MRLYEIFGADVLRVAQVFAEVLQHPQIVAPHSDVVDMITVASGDEIRCPEFIRIAGIGKKVFHFLNLSGFHQRFHPWV